MLGHIATLAISTGVFPIEWSSIALIDLSQYSPALPSGHPFTNVLLQFYGSSTGIKNSAATLDVSMWRGETDGGTKDSSYYVWYVRGGINEPTPNSPPTLSYSFDLGYGTDGVDPESGTTATTFTYKAIYTDADDEAPTSLNVHIDGGSNAMTVDSGCGTLCDGDYTNGEQYVYSITLSSGSHDYYLDTSDGTDTDRLPASGTLSGPTVYALLNIVTSTLTRWH